MTHSSPDFSRLSQHEVADMIGVSARTIRRWTRADGMPRHQDGTYSAPRVIAWLLRAPSSWFSARAYLTWTGRDD